MAVSLSNMAGSTAPGEVKSYPVEKGLSSSLIVAGLPQKYFLFFALGSLPITLGSLALGLSAGTIAGFTSEVILEALLYLFLRRLCSDLGNSSPERLIRGLTLPSGVKVRSRPWRNCSISL